MFLVLNTMIMIFQKNGIIIIQILIIKLKRLKMINKNNYLEKILSNIIENSIIIY